MDQQTSNILAAFYVLCEKLRTDGMIVLTINGSCLPSSITDDEIVSYILAEKENSK